MSRIAPHERFEELAAGYALHALEPADEQAFQEHLAACSACAQAVREHEQTLGHLAYASATDPPPALLEGIRAAIAAEGTAAPRGPAQADRSAPVDLAAVRERRRKRLVARGPGLWAGAAAAMVAVLALVMWNVSLQRERAQQVAWADQVSRVVARLVAPGSQEVRLKNPAGVPVAVAVVHAGTVDLVLDGLAPNDRRRSIYVLWEKDRKGLLRPVGTFDVRGPGLDVASRLALPVPDDALTLLAVTQEPGRTAPAKPGHPIVAAAPA